MKFTQTSIPEVVLIEPVVFGDDRGFFTETWNRREFAENGIDVDFVQDNHSRSAKSVLRGIHYQLLRPQGKLVRVTSGRVLDVAVDLRKASATFGKWVSIELSAENKRMLWVPPGFGHGFFTLEESTEFLYKCTDFYAPLDEHCLRWDDRNLAIDWQLGGAKPALSAKDRAGKAWEEAQFFI